IRDRIEAGEVAGPKIQSTGPILYPKGIADISDAQLQMLGFMKFSSPEINDAAQGHDEASGLGNRWNQAICRSFFCADYFNSRECHRHRYCGSPPARQVGVRASH